MQDQLHKNQFIYEIERQGRRSVGYLSAYPVTMRPLFRFAHIFINLQSSGKENERLTTGKIEWINFNFKNRRQNMKPIKRLL